MEKANEYITFSRKLQSYKMINHIELLIKGAKCVSIPALKNFIIHLKELKECKALY